LPIVIIRNDMPIVDNPKFGAKLDLILPKGTLRQLHEGQVRATESAFPVFPSCWSPLVGGFASLSGQPDRQLQIGIEIDTSEQISPSSVTKPNYALEIWDQFGN
jgi:hypothetical protein